VLRLRIVLAIALLTSGFSIFQMALPNLTFACSCIQPKAIGEYANEPDTLVLTGTVTAMDPEERLGTFRVERWYKGESETPDILIRSGDGADCGIPLTVGQELVMVAYAEEQTLVPSICSPWADLSMPEGQQLQADAVAAYGEGTPPGGAETPGAESPPGLAIPGIVLIGGGALLAIIVIVAGASLISARRGS
jgi:hypothetical protein